MTIRPVPAFETGKEAADFVDRADLTDYDPPGGHVVKFELKPNDKAVNLRLPEALLPRT